MNHSTTARRWLPSGLLLAFVMTGLFFMLVPGTMVGVWNLISISSVKSPGSISASWTQAHGHAQVFGWIGSFVLGIGFYSIPKMRGGVSFGLWKGYASWILWTIGVFLRWGVNMWYWNWRVLLPASAVLEMTAFVIFFSAVLKHRSQDGQKSKADVWIKPVVAATIGLGVALGINLVTTVHVAGWGQSAVVPRPIQKRFLTVSLWGALVPLVWGFSARWMPVFLGLKPLRDRVLLMALGAGGLGVLMSLVGCDSLSALLVLCAALLSVHALRFFEPTETFPKTRGVHVTFPVFVRLAYVWLVVSAGLSLWATLENGAPGIEGASRHALTVGFLSTMVFSVGPRVLPAFTGANKLFSTRLMFLSLLALSAGCTLRVTCEIAAYESGAGWAWTLLPVSALAELGAIMLFAANMAATVSPGLTGPCWAE